MKADMGSKMSRTTRWSAGRLGLALLVLVLMVLLLPGAETAIGRPAEPLGMGSKSGDAPGGLQATPDSGFGINQGGVGWTLVVVSSTEPAGVEHIGSVAGFNNTFGLSSPVDVELYRCRDVGAGHTVDLGTFPAGTELIFRLTTPEGHTFYNGPGTRNPDGLVHAAITQLGPEQWQLGWEDIFGGGDLDYNDCEMIITGAVAGVSQLATPTPTFTPTPIATDTATPTATSTPTPTFTPTPTPTPTPSPVLEAEKSGTLLVDADNNSVLSPGDTLRYDVTILSSGGAAATGVYYSDAIDSNTTLVANSVQTSQGTVISGNNPADTTVEVDIGTIPGGGGSVTISFDVTINNPLPAGVSQIVNQGVASSNELPDVPTDDPGTVPDDDPTVNLITAEPVLEAEKMATLLVDADNTNGTSPGDTLLYEVTIVNSGNIAATGVSYIDVIDINTTLVANSVQTSQGTVISGNNPADTTIEVDIGVMPGGGSTVTISFEVTINLAMPGTVTEIVNQGIVSSNELPDVPTDDPTTTPDDDPTAVPVSPGPMTPGICWQLAGRIPQAVVDHALANPEMYFGWGQCVNPNAPCPSPWNPYRHWLSLLNINASYHPMWNPPIWQPSCPK